MSETTEIADQSADQLNKSTDDFKFEKHDAKSVYFYKLS